MPLIDSLYLAFRAKRRYQSRVGITLGFDLFKQYILVEELSPR